jgi:hypothetical protein
MPESEKPPKTLETPAPEPEAAKPEGLATTVAETPETKPRTDILGL